MKVIAILSLLLFLTTPAFSELTKEDLQTLKEDLRTIIKEEITASEKRTREYIDLKIETVNAKIDATNARIDALNKSFDRAWVLILALIGLITAAIAIPQIIIAHKESGRKEMQTQIDQLRKEIEALSQ